MRCNVLLSTCKRMYAYVPSSTHFSPINAQASHLSVCMLFTDDALLLGSTKCIREVPNARGTYQCMREIPMHDGSINARGKNRHLREISRGSCEYYLLLGLEYYLLLGLSTWRQAVVCDGEKKVNLSKQVGK